MERRPRRVEDYTAPALVMLFVNLLWMLGVLWAWLGLPAVLLAGLGLNHAISRLAARRARG